MKKQNMIIIVVVAFLLMITIGYALFSESLSINGTALAEGTFDVEFTSVGTPTCIGFTGTCDSNTLTGISSDKNTLNVTVNKLEFPGAYVEFPVTVTSKGTIPAVLESISETGLETDDTIKVTYTGISELKGQKLEQNGTQTFSIKVKWDENSNKSSENVQFSIKMNYKQIAE